MKRDPSRIRQNLKRTEESRASSLKQILQERGPIRRGAFVTVHRKCGKPNCRCATGEGHPAKYLSVKESGKTRMLYVPSNAELKVKEEAGRYRRLRQARAKLAKLAKQSLQLIDELERALETTEEIPGKRKTKQRPAPRRKPQRKKNRTPR